MDHSKQKQLRKQIPLVEDDELFRQAVTDHLAQQSDIRTAESADTLHVPSNKGTPDLLLLDLTLPGTDGIETLKIIRNRWPELPVIMLTAIDKIQAVVECIKMGAVDYIAKPFIVEELLASLQRALENVE